LTFGGLSNHLMLLKIIQRMTSLYDCTNKVIKIVLGSPISGIICFIWKIYCSEITNWNHNYQCNFDLQWIRNLQVNMWNTEFERISDKSNY